MMTPLDWENPHSPEAQIARLEQLLEAVVTDIANGVKKEDLLARFAEHKRLIEELA